MLKPALVVLAIATSCVLFIEDVQVSESFANSAR